MKKYVIGIGEALFDCLPEGRKLGGAPANFAYHVSQFGLNGCAVSAIGEDELGQEIVDKFTVIHNSLSTFDFRLLNSRPAPSKSHLMTKACRSTRYAWVWLGIIYPLRTRCWI